MKGDLRAAEVKQGSDGGNAGAVKDVAAIIKDVDVGAN